MKKFLRTAGFACLMAAGALAQAADYNFSYTFGNGDIASGSFSGDASGNLIGNLSDISVYINGVGFRDNGDLSAYSLGGGGTLGGSAVVSFDGTANSFVFLSFRGEEQFLSGSFINFPFTDTAAFNTVANGGYGYGDGDSSTAYDAGRWSVSVVPEPETYAMLLAGLGLVGFAARRRA